MVEAAARGTPSVVVDGPENAATELVETGSTASSPQRVPRGSGATRSRRVVEAGPALRESTARWFAENAKTLRIERLAGARGRGLRTRAQAAGSTMTSSSSGTPSCRPDPRHPRAPRVDHGVADPQPPARRRPSGPPRARSLRAGLRDELRETDLPVLERDRRRGFTRYGTRTQAAIGHDERRSPPRSSVTPSSRSASAVSDLASRSSSKRSGQAKSDREVRDVDHGERVPRGPQPRRAVLAGRRPDQNRERRSDVVHDAPVFEGTSSRQSCLTRTQRGRERPRQRARDRAEDRGSTRPAPAPPPQVPRTPTRSSTRPCSRRASRSRRTGSSPGSPVQRPAAAGARSLRHPRRIRRAARKHRPGHPVSPPGSWPGRR